MNVLTLPSEILELTYCLPKLSKGKAHEPSAFATFYVTLYLCLY